MNRRTAIRQLATFFLTSASLAHAQQPKKVPLLGYLSTGNSTSESTRAEGIRLAVRERGYIEGQNIAIEYRYGEGKLDRAAQLAADLVRLKVDIIVAAGGTRLVRAAKNATKTIPIVMVGPGGDPIAAGLIDSLARPGGNVTGLTLLVRELGGKQLELLKEAVPKLTRVAVLYDPAFPANVSDVKEVLPAPARALRLTLQPWEVRDADGFDKVFATLNKQRPDGLYVPIGPLMRHHRKRIAGFALLSVIICAACANYRKVHRGGTEDAEERVFFVKIHSELCELRVSAVTSLLPFGCGFAALSPLRLISPIPNPSLTTQDIHHHNHLPHNCLVAMRAPSAIAWNFAQPTCGWPTLDPMPQSVPAIMFSRPTILA